MSYRFRDRPLAPDSLTSKTATNPAASAASAQAAGGGVRQKARGPRKRFWPSPLVTSTVVFLVIWEAIVDLLHVPAFILPPPVAVGYALWAGLTADPTSTASLINVMLLTLRGALIGYVVGVIAGVVLGVLVSESRLLNSVLLPYAFALQSLPKVAVAPLILIWFGYGLPSTVVLAALLTFFPLMLNTYAGLTLVERDYMVLMRGLRASRWQTLVTVKFPSALPVIFAGLDAAVVFSLLGAVVAEFVAGSAGIGVSILQYQSSNATAAVFAALAVLAVTGNLLHALVKFAERKIVFWRQPEVLRMPEGV